MAPPIEISVPTTSVTSPPDAKPFTQYNITLRLPLRSYVVQKRYTDFNNLHTALTSLVGAPPPAPLPGKHWFKSTVSSAELTEDRRRGLETYLRSIAESPDRRWRDTPAWRSFLNLPAVGGGSAASSSGIGVEGKLPAINTREGNAAAASDPRTWTDLHREMKGLLGEARQQLSKRDAASDVGVGYIGGAPTQALEAGAAAKRALVRASNLIRALDDGLKDMGDRRKLGEGELLRRRDLVAAARQERDGLEKVGASIGGSAGHGAAGGRDGPVSSGDKAVLLGRGGTGTARRVLGAPLPETERTRELDNAGVLLLQKQQMAEQDQDVEELTRIVRRQRDVGMAIEREVREQLDLLNETDEHVTRVGVKLDVANKKTRKLGQ
ncbi:Phox-like protein [Cryphonectria parasitica EP155]|uniref:Phox-like protein n=1 Tax=Cryphonectria parasitica (strain ATCC 38755 / EP155) TaxID=660469 RepID=A0A9P5CTJ1_CRYP1|nr:Phox-like protein [Cryphonectria parasitica EP155]KAF3769727.1 Phox-like protein [Cryphonectria parasitica EP155]